MIRVLWAAFVLFLTVLPGRGNACTCIGIEHEQSIRAAKIIFAVHVDGVEPDSLSSIRNHYSVRVLAVWKGVVPESTTVSALNGAACGYPLEVGKDHLIYITRHKDGEELESERCVGSGLLEDLYYDRYLLGEPKIRYDDGYETVTLDMMLDGIIEPSPEAEEFAWQFRSLSIEAPLLLPKLRRIARQDLPGNQMAAVRAIGLLGPEARVAYDDLRFVYENWARKQPVLRAAALNAMLSVDRDYSTSEQCLAQAINDPELEVRLVVVSHIRNMNNSDGLAVRRIIWRALADPDARVRSAAIRVSRYEDVTAETARCIRAMSRSDEDADVRSAARNYLEIRERWANFSRPYRSVDRRGFEHQERRR